MTKLSKLSKFFKIVIKIVKIVKIFRKCHSKMSQGLEGRSLCFKIKMCLTHSLSQSVSNQWQGHLLSCLWTAKCCQNCKKKSCQDCQNLSGHQMSQRSHVFGVANCVPKSKSVSVIKEWLSDKDKVTYWAVCGQIRMLIQNWFSSVFSVLIISWLCFSLWPTVSLTENCCVILQVVAGTRLNWGSTVLGTKGDVPGLDHTKHRALEGKLAQNNRDQFNAIIYHLVVLKELHY